MALTGAEAKLVKNTGFNQTVGELLKKQCGKTLKRLKVFNQEGEHVEVPGIASATSREAVLDHVAALQPKLAPLGYRAFWSELYSATGSKSSDVVAVLKTKDEAEIIRVCGSNGGNYGVSNEDVLAKIQDWRKLCKLEVVGASGSWVALQFQTLPKNLGAFAEEIYDFCPDSVDQGVGLQNEQDDPEKFAAARKLVPKLSAKMEKKLKAREKSIAAMDLSPEIRAMLAQSSFTTKTDMGIRLLAYEIHESKMLFLWWD